MLCIPEIDDRLKNLMDDEMKDFVATILSEYFKSARGRLYFKLNEE